jgi:MFS family permease
MDLKTDHHPASPSAPDVADEKQHHMIRDEVYIDPQEEKALLRKLDRWIVPPVMLLYLFSFLDRVSSIHPNPIRKTQNPNSNPKAKKLPNTYFTIQVNIGNARLYGMEADLHLTGNQYQIAVSLLFVTYIASELPSNLVIKKFTPSRWLSFITTAWGVVATLTGITQGFKGLVACRIILGALEGGLFPGLGMLLLTPLERCWWWMVV